MKTTHQIHFQESDDMHQLNDASVNLVVTSPPYPMIAMWDYIVPVDETNPQDAFNLWHFTLDNIWKECIRVTKDGGFICINIGDATRTINGKFSIFPNHVRIINFFMKQGVTVLPSIIWKKPTNAPNKFMGSGMLPSGAYVTLEHEHILIFRKGDKQSFKSNDNKMQRRKSAFFWEERNVWFSDTWNLLGVSQGVKNTSRERSAAYPFELPYRLINMFSMMGDVVLDPFMGTGTTMMAAIASGRNSVGYELDATFRPIILQKLADNSEWMQTVTPRRITSHMAFVEDRKANGKTISHYNKHHQFPVITAQEVDIELPFIESISINDELIESTYRSLVV